MNNVVLHPLTAKEIVYIVFHGGALVHIGESKSIVRAFNYVRNLEKTRGAGATARFFELTSDVRADLALPKEVPAGCLFRGNVERLLQAAFTLRYGEMPQCDDLRGGKGSKAGATGGYIAGTNVLQNLFALVDELIAPTPKALKWPDDLLNTDDGVIDPAGSTRRPATRLRYLAFWVEFSEDESLTAHVGYCPDNNGTPGYREDTREIKWSREIVPAQRTAVAPTSAGP